MKVTIKAVAATPLDSKARKALVGQASQNAVNSIKSQLAAAGFVEDRQIGSDGFSFLWKSNSPGVSLSTVELLGSIQPTPAGRKTELLEHIYIRETKSRPTTKMKALVKNSRFDFSESADLGDYDECSDYVGFVRELSRALGSKLVVTGGAKDSSLEASDTFIVSAEALLRKAGFEPRAGTGGTGRVLKTSSGYSVSKHWSNSKSRSSFVFTFACDSKGKSLGPLVGAVLMPNGSADPNDFVNFGKLWELKFKSDASGALTWSASNGSTVYEKSLTLALKQISANLKLDTKYAGISISSVYDKTQDSFQKIYQTLPKLGYSSGNLEKKMSSGDLELNLDRWTDRKGNVFDMYIWLAPRGRIVLLDKVLVGTIKGSSAKHTTGVTLINEEFAGSGGSVSFKSNTELNRYVKGLADAEKLVLKMAGKAR